ncbi:hypothetical protein UA08_06387 [Talaromyces atroroseus]|uniref:Multicopper oxidase n=1 Tax=Talaromyces atroroseus TaxID=1441469 RepID=A0A225AXK9_TALAT|nr:hypothetical protein UA08_06387 [Talaromyces atroroseus]OKL58237.1 hypothetical protein UA08_06387 [Talaromyces atroroseus]
MQTLNWSITSGHRRPDGVRKKVYLINGVFPGPTIEARSGDTLQILVRNDLEDEEISLHWHGLYMRGANTMDGATGVTQCGIGPGKSFWYNFTISEAQSGTFWYHAHSNVQRADGLYGGFVVHRPVSPSFPNVRGLFEKHRGLNDNMSGEMRVPDSVEYVYDKELLLMIGDWYHRTAQDVASWYLWWGSRGYEGKGSITALFDRGMSTDNPRSLTGITLGVAKGKLEVITLDGGIPVETKPHVNDKSSAGVLFPGQRMDFILRPPKDRGDHYSWITVKLDESDFKIGNPALEPLQSFPILLSPVSSSSLLSIQPDTLEDEKNIISSESNIIDIQNLSSTPTILAALPSKAEQIHVVYAKVEKLSRLQNIPHGFFNRTTWKMQSNPAYPLLGLARNQWDKHQLAITTGDRPVWIDFIVNNLDEGAHPFHLHGHNFYVVAVDQSADGSTWGSYNPWSKNKIKNGPYLQDGNSEVVLYDLSKAVLRDTVQIPRRGYAVLRIRADNPGVWLFHCHVMWHLVGGMAMLIDSMNGSDDVAHQPWLAVEGSECRV